MAKEEHEGKTLPQIADILGIGKFDTHLFICTGPDCCDEKTGFAAWDVVKRTVKALNPVLNASKIYRTKVGCLRVCKDGPIAVAYPQGKWFHHVTSENAESIVQHLQAGAEEPHPLQFIVAPLPAEGAAGDGAADGASADGAAVDGAAGDGAEDGGR